LNKIQDNVKPGNKWAFDEDVTDAFDDMLLRSIPQYNEMRKLCFSLAKSYRVKNTDIVDLGCSRGEAMANLVDEYGATNRFIGVEISQPMLEASKARFSGLISAGTVDIKELDLRKEYPNVMASITFSVLTLQFTPIEYRLRILHNIYNSTLSGGVLILVEKVLGSSAEIDELMVDHYYDFKRENGYTEDDIERKRLSLEGVLVPVTAKWNEELLANAGFKYVDCFWRWMNFAGWIAKKE
jgi:tRNA (cmo5U34)-methyltransferase